MKLIKWLLITFALLIAIILFNTLSFTQEQIELTPLLDSSLIDQSAVTTRLSQAIQHKTISFADKSDRKPESFYKFHRFLASSFPLLHQKLTQEKINDLSLLYVWAGSDKSLKPMLLMSHLDVVPVAQETKNQWTHNPFAGEIANGIIWGRGAIDIKSGVMGIMEAVENLIAQGYQPKRSIYLAFGHDEELGGEQGAKQIAKHLKAQKLTFELILDEGGSIVSNGVIPGIESPIALIGIAEKGYVSLKLTANATGGHSSMPPKHTALGEISQAIVDLENNPFPANLTYSKQLFNNIGPAMDTIKKAVFANMWLTEPIVEKILSASQTTNATIRTTTAATMATGSNKDNVLPTQASAIINFRIMPGETINSVTHYVTDIIDNPNINIEQLAGFGNNPSSVSITNNANFQRLKQSIYRVTQDESMIITPYLVMGGTDAKHYSELSDSIYRFAFNRFKPETLGQMHGINEQIKIDDYLDTIKFFREIILAMN
ncbi:MAG: M20/M25/M40 family metallo-hydrolase [Colwellia sp.]|nr:M20/M25/M40 family metallo-hydrolase [Colwellia sp.]